MKGLIKYELKKMISVWWLVYVAVMLLVFCLLDWKEHYGLLFALVSLHISRGAGDATRADAESGWLALQGIFPVSKRQYLTAKYIRYGVVCVLNACFIFTLIGIRCALSGTFGFHAFWLPLLAYLTLYLGMSSMFPDILSLKGRGLRMLFIRIGLTIAILGSSVLIIVLADNLELTSRLLPFVIGFLVVGAAVCVLNAKERLDQFEEYELGIPSELQKGTIFSE